MIKLLALDTSTESCSVALYTDQETLTLSKIIPQRHSQEILKMIDHILSQGQTSLNQIDAIAFGQGPGSFTGLRIVTAVTQGLVFALDRPAIAISTLTALAQQAWRLYQASSVLSAIDARMQEIYWGAFRIHNGYMQSIQKEQVINPEFATIEDSDTNQDQWIGIGTGWNYQPTIPTITIQHYVQHYPQAEDIAKLAIPSYNDQSFLTAENITPTYLRNQVAHKKTSST